jgi:RNA polymerase sigma factor (sigma-70 family)
MSDIPQLLRAYVDDASEDAFQEIVARYLDLVYFTALRRTGGDAPMAEDVAQIVFTDFARKARSLRADSALGGWLHRHTCFVSSTIMRHERARLEREQHALEMNALESTGEPSWKDIAPALDEAIDELSDADRHAVLLRFFEHRDFRSVGAAIGASEDTAQKRVSRAVAKLRALLARRGIVLSAAALAGLLAAGSVSASPAGLCARIGRAAWSATAGSAGSPSAMKVLIDFMKTKKLALALGFAGIAAFVAAPLLSREPHSTAASLAAATSPAAPEVSAATPAPKSSPTAPASAGVSSTTLHLNFVALDSGSPVPNVPLDCREFGSKGGRRHLIANRDGTLDVAVPKSVQSISLSTQVEGFADTRLHWDTTRGEQIPSTYTVRLDRPAPIGGKVVDTQGNPVPDASVGFNAHEDPSQASAPEDHEFGWIEVKTGPDGRWAINRIATNMIHRIFGGANHPEHLEARVGNPPRPQGGSPASDRLLRLQSRFGGDGQRCRPRPGRETCSRGHGSGRPSGQFHGA